MNIILQIIRGIIIYAQASSFRYIKIARCAVQLKGCFIPSAHDDSYESDMLVRV